MLRTPLCAAFFYIVVLPGCNVDQAGSEVTVDQCPADTTSIPEVQGRSTNSPMRGQRVTVQGIVTLVRGGQGLYIEDPVADQDSHTSNAIYVQANHLPAWVNQGSLVSVKGQVSEIGDGPYTLTAITAVDELIQCASSLELPSTNVALPLDGGAREALEGMRITLNDTLTVSDVYQFGQGFFTLSGNGIQFVPTEVMAPGPETVTRQAQNRAFPLQAQLAKNIDERELMVSGTTLGQVTGVLAHDGQDLRMLVQSVSDVQPAHFAAPPPAATGTLRIAGMNLHNYFNGDGRGSGFPTPRGAETVAEFQQQRGRIGAAIKALDPHLVGVMELENDGFGPESAAQDFVTLANDATIAAWAVSRPVGDDTGDDKITVGLFYRSDRVTAIGPARTLTGPEFTRSRQPLAQVFKPLPDGEKILVVINHLKSKGSCPDHGENADQKDGQGCWNPVRLASANLMSAWAKSLAAAAGTDNILVLGDMNAYRREDPVEAMRKAGFTELLDEKRGQVYSFAYRGQYGSLDYAFSSGALAGKVKQAFIWSVNASLPTHMDLPQPWLRFSDHDPVVVDLSLRHSSTSD